MKADLVTRHQEKTAREPVFHIVKRGAVDRKWPYLVRIIAILAALFVCAILSVIVTGENPVGIFGAMIKGSFGSVRIFLSLLSDMAILLCISLAVTPAFKMRFWNIGAEGQVLAGGIAAAACMIYIGKLPFIVLFPIMLLASVAAGMIWAFLPAICKAVWGTNETLFTLMMNYIAMQVVRALETVWEGKKGSGHIGVISNGRFPKLFNISELLPILIVAAIVVMMYIYLRYSKHGYEIEVVGESENTARYIGINVKKVIVRTMLVSGAVCGIAGLLLVAGTDHTISPNTAGGDGFTAIMVSWLAKFNPLYMILTTFLLVFLERGGGEIATQFKLNPSFPEILTGVILFFIIGCEFFIRYSISFTHKRREKLPADAPPSEDSTVKKEDDQ